jgi:hypothetical protein
MRQRIVASVALGLAVLLGAAACSDRPKEWLKVNEKYTTAEFRRDYAECTRGGKLDEECMKARGWVAVSPGKEVKPVEPTRIPGQPRGRYY